MPRFGEYDPGAWGWPRCSAQAFAPFTYDGHSFPQGVVVGHNAYWTKALKLLCAQPGFRLPNSTKLDAGCWGQSCRPIAGTNRWSFHAYGLALDVAAPWNGQGADPPSFSPHRLPTNTGSLLRGMGIEWGGDWRSAPDWMHIESHLAPSEMAAWLRLNAGPGAGGTFPLPEGWYFGPYDGPEQSVSGSGRQDARWRPFLARAQRKLHVTADGLYGPDTASATRRWQSVHGLTADGLIGRRTWGSLSP